MDDLTMKLRSREGIKKASKGDRWGGEPGLLR